MTYSLSYSNFNISISGLNEILQRRACSEDFEVATMGAWKIVREGQHVTPFWDFSERIKIEGKINIPHINNKNKK
jgi:hypothetical protein